MLQRLVVIVAGLLVGAAATLVATSASAATTISVVEHAASEKYLDLGRDGDSPGDMLTFHNKVYDETDTTVVGTDQGYCVRISSRRHASWECVFTTFLEDGQITVQTPFNDVGDSVGAITGGTGLYAGAAGTFDLHCFDVDDTHRCEFVFSLT